jgi:uncharacterized membrane protein
MRDRLLSIVLTIVVLGVMGVAVYLIVKPGTGEGFTEFYILGLDGTTENYPQELAAGEEGTVMVNVTNHEHVDASYWIEVRVEANKYNEVGPVVLEDNERWEQRVSFAAIGTPGTKVKIEFWLYKDIKEKPYLGPLNLWVNIK